MYIPIFLLQKSNNIICFLNSQGDFIFNSPKNQQEVLE